MRQRQPTIAAGAADRVPRATYRLQLHRDYGFRQAAALVPYLADLGISHVYCSPFVRAVDESRHGYDVVDHNTLNPEIGTTEDFEALVAALQAHGMGLMIDLVPNHMGISGTENAWWQDVLEHGPASAHAGHFDIDWAPSDPLLQGRVLIPVLGAPYGATLDAGEIGIDVDATAGRCWVTYHANRYPIDPREYPRLLGPALGRLGPDAPGEAARVDWNRLLERLAALPERTSGDAAARTLRAAEAKACRAELARLLQAHPAFATAVAAEAGALAEPGRAGELDRLLQAQAWRLAWWRVAGDAINYRRFFDVDGLAALRMERDDVFDEAHRLLLRWVGAGAIDALRIDHPDGLADPAGYLRKLADRAAAARAAGGAAETSPPAAADDPVTPADPPTRSDRPTPAGPPTPLYLVVEKILAPFEHLPADWPVDGTTGYRFANLAVGLFVDRSNEAALTDLYARFTGTTGPFEAIALDCKQLALRALFASELGRLAAELHRVALADRHGLDYTPAMLRRALEQVVVCFPVYRSYIAETVSDDDRRFVRWAIGVARTRSPRHEWPVLDFVAAVLTGGAGAAGDPERSRFVVRFQQLTAPVMAKGVEDTALYRYLRLASLNDVGGDPGAFGIGPRAFHGAGRYRARHRPHALLATSTHDNKRSEDVRLRINLLSEMPGRWQVLLARWSTWNRRHRSALGTRRAPSANDEYLYYQTLLGSMPADPAQPLGPYRARVAAYLQKAAREAKCDTSWLAPDADYEQALQRFVDATLAEHPSNRFLADLRAELPHFAWFGALGSLAATLLKLTSPGVPDIYQGNELLDHSLVDPDNRRAVDYDLRRRLAAQALQETRERPLDDWLRDTLAAADGPGRVKQWLIRRVLGLRRAHPALFAEGGYEPLATVDEGAGASAAEPRLFGYVRRHREASLVTVTGRRFASLGASAGCWPPDADAWEGAEIVPPGPGRYVDLLTGRVVGPQDWQAAILLRTLPCALLQPAD